MRGARWLHWVWSSEPAEVYRSFETPNELLQRFEASAQPDSLRNPWSDDYAMLMKRTARGMRLRIRTRRLRSPMFAYVRLKDRGDHTEVSLTFGYGPLFDAFGWIHAALFVVCIAGAPREPGLLVVAALLMLMFLGLRRLGRRGFDQRAGLRSIVVGGLRKPASPEAAGELVGAK